MRASESGSGDSERVRLQVVLCESLASKVEQQAEELQHSQCWVAGWSIGLALDDKAGFARWVSKRIQSPKDFPSWLGCAGTLNEQRLQLRIEKAVADELDSIAGALNQSPAKLAGLMIQFGIEEYALTFKLRKTKLAKGIRRLLHGKEDATKFDDTKEQSAESNAVPF